MARLCCSRESGYCGFQSNQFVNYVLFLVEKVLTLKVLEFALKNAFLGHGTRFLGAVRLKGFDGPTQLLQFVNSIL